MIINPFVFGGGEPVTYKAHRYWKINVTANRGSIYLRMLGPSGYSLSGGALINPVSVSASSNVYEDAAGMFFGTAWSTSWSNPQWVVADLGAPYAIGDLMLKADPTPSNPERSFKDFTVQWSDDGTNWNISATFTNVDLTSGAPQHFVVGDPAA